MADVKQASNFPKISGHRVRQRRRDLGLTMEVIAKQSGFTVQSWYHWELGMVQPRVKNLPKIAEALDCELIDLFEPSAAAFFSALKTEAYDLLNDAETPIYERVLGGSRVSPIIMQLAKEEAERESIGSAAIDWRNPNLLAFRSERSRAVKAYEASKPLVLSGPTRCAKTLLLLEWLFSLHFANPGFRSLVLRANAVDLSETLRRDIRDTLLKFDLEDPISPCSVSGRGGSRNFKSIAINGGEMVLGGMNRPGRVLGTSYNLIFCSQIEQFTEEQFQFLLTRCAGDRAGWLDSDGQQRGLLIGDANPDEANHWLLKAAEADRVDLRYHDFTDNPLFYTADGEQTETGRAVVNQLDESLQGIYHDRFFKGQWVSVEGKVFDVDESVHVVDKVLIDSEYMWYRACDFGITAPSVCLWIAECKKTNDVFVVREFRKTGIDTIALGSEINRLTQRSERVIDTIIDNDADKQSILRKHCGIRATLTQKNAHSVMDGVHLIKDALANARDGNGAGLFFLRDVRCNADATLIRDKKPLSTLDEMKAYRVNPETDKPYKQNDHGIDALRYWFLWRETRLGSTAISARGVSRIV